MPTVEISQEYKKDVEQAGEKVEVIEGGERLRDILSSRAQETYTALNPESKNFVAKLYEKVKSSEVAQNLVDRYQVWKNERLAARAGRRVEKLNSQRDEAQQTVDAREDAAKKTAADFKNLRATLEGMGKKLSPADEAKVNKEIEAHNTLADGARFEAQGFQGRARDVEKEFENYENEVKTARGRLDGRLAAKMEKNNEAAAAFERKLDDVNRNLDKNNLQLRTLDEHALKLGGLLETVTAQSVRETIEKQLAEIESQKAHWQKLNGLLEEERVKLEPKIKNYKQINAGLEQKRERVFPRKERLAKKEKPRAKPVSAKVNAAGVFILDYGGGLTKSISKDTIIETRPDGTETVSPLTAETLLKEFKLMSPEILAAFKVPPAVVERLKEKVARERAGQNVSMTTDVVARWNAKVGAESGFSLGFEDFDEILKDPDMARDYLSDGLQRKVTGKKGEKLSSKLSTWINEVVDKYFLEKL